MSVDEEDYMSDLFIPPNPTVDIKPGLNPKMRKIKERVKPVSMKVLEIKKREDGLQTPLSVDNKGFTMLAKMGFKSGSGLGKSGEGRSEPVSINIKNNREGLGVSQIRKEMMQLQAKLLRKQIKNTDCSVDAYRKRCIEKALERSCNADLLKSQRVCFTLDVQKGVTEPLREWFWENYDGKNNAEKEEIVEEMDSDKPLGPEVEVKVEKKIYVEVKAKEEPVVEVNVTELGVEVNKVKELNVNDEVESHLDAQVKEEPINDEFLDEELTAQDKLKLLTLYLRRTYFYCIWCGTQFVDEIDLQECPGSSREDH